MKQKCSFILRSTIALILTALMIFGSISTVLAATVDIAATGADADVAESGWNNTTWYLGNDIAKVWDNSASNCTMTKSGTVKFYYDLYLKSTDADVYYRPYEKDNYAMGPTAGKDTKVTTSGTAGAGYNDGRCWYFDTADCTANKYNKIRIWIDTSGNNNNGWSWYEKTAINNISPTLNVPSTGTVGTAITLTGGSTDENKIGALTKTYQYYNGSSWVDLTSGSYTATSAGTVKFRYKVSDDGVKTSGTSVNGRTARVEYSSEKSCTFSAASCDYYTHVMWRDFGGTTYTPDAQYGSVQRNTGTEPTADIGSLATSNTFDGWYVGDNGTATSTTGLTKYPDNSSYTNSSIDIAYNTSVKHYYAFLTRPEPSYSVTVAKGTGGNVASTSVTAHPSTKVTLPTATPSAGYHFKNWTATTGITITNADSASAAQITATGTGTVTANFEAIPATTIYVKKTLASTFSNIHIWSNTSDNWTGAWPGQALSGWSSTTDGKYYYKSFNQNYSTFKFILNNNTSPQTNDSAAYDTGKSYYIDSATANSAAVLTEGVPKASTITYNSGTGYTISGTKPTSAYTGETVSFTVTASDGYRIDKVQYTPTGGTATTITASSGTYSFTMPDKNVTVSVTAVKTYTVTLSAGTGFKTKQYKLGSSGTYKTYSSALTVDSDTDVYFKVAYSDGYEFDSQSGGTQVTAKTEYRTGAVAGDKTVTIKAKKINYTVTYPTGTGYTIGGTKPSTATINDTVSFTVTPDTGYRINSVKYQYSDSSSSTTLTGTNNAYSFTLDTAKNVSILVNASKVNTVKAVTNKTSRGTITVDKSTAAKDEVVKITVSPAAGILKTLTATYTASGNTYECAVTNGTAGNTWTEVIASGGAAAPLKARGSVEIAEVGANIALAAVGSSQTVNMIMQEDSAVTINATFDTYSGDSTWYYNGYDTSGNAVSGYHGKQMTESMVSGEKFSYYHVEGRTGNDQLMTVSNGAASSGTRYVYFTASAEGGWSTDENHQYAYFYNGSGAAGNAWPGYKMTKYTTNDYGQNVYRVAIPTSSNPTGVIFNNADNAAHQTTNVTDLSKGGYYLLNTSHWDATLQKTIHDWQSYDCTYPSAGYSTGTEYFYGSDNNQSTVYSTDSNGKSIFDTTGFYRHGADSKNFAKPRLTNSNNGDYYVNVLYPNTTYTINSVTQTIGSDPVVIWSTEPLAGDDENVTIYAKDGAIRSSESGSTYANIADTKIYAANGSTTVGTKKSGNITNQTYETYKATKGETIVIKTQIGATDTGNLSNAADLKAKYYVRGFCVNGEVSKLLEVDANGLYTLTYKVPEDTELTKIEITPIYYLKDTTANPIVTYRVTGFTDELKAVGAGKPGWGDTLYTYPFYGKLGGQNNSFGAYPGQPMVYYKGQYQMQIPQKSTAWEYDNTPNNTIGATSLAQVNNTPVSGVTMSNGFYDLVHRQIMGYGDNSSSADHVQTYDYGDFYKIFKEKSAEGNPVDNIVFDFKYNTKKHNLTDIITTSTTASALNTKYGTGGNGFEDLTNFHGRKVDLFGTPLSGDQLNATPVYVVSTGGVIDNTSGVENIAGYYATEWVVYGSSNGTNYNRITDGKSNGKSSIPPEVLVLNDDDETSFNNTTYPSADANHTLTQWKELYTALEAYRGKPVKISYEAADAQQGQGMYYTGTGGATRNDGRWLYSKNGESITSNIKIQYSNDNGANYTDLDTTTPQVNGLSAYFTNDGVEGEMTYATTIDPDKTFDFEAKTTNANYKFVGWFMEDGTKITTDNASHTERSGSYTFVAKFMEVQGGQLILSHSADKGTINSTDYQGAGTAKISAVVKNGDEVVRTYDLSTSDITMDDKIIKSDSPYTIEVTLEATATGYDSLGTTVLANPSGSEATYFTTKSSSTVGKTKTMVLNSFTVASLFSGTTQNVKNIIYHSYFSQAVFNYTLTFNYNDRFNKAKSFTRQGKLTSAQAANTNYVENSNGTLSLLPAFIQTVAPFESNIGENITWNITKQTFNESGSNYNCTGTIAAEQTKATKKNVTFKLPYQHTNGIVSTGKTGTAAETTDFDLTGNNAVAIDTIPVLLNNAENGVYVEAEKKNWIVAPSTINDNGTTKYFQYWSVKSTSADKDTDPDVARCYFEGFNFCVFDNYVVTPVYGTEKTSVSDSGIYSGASYLETSRNQWNDNSDRYKTETEYASDLLYNDFILNYNYKGVDIYKGGTDTNDILELGVVVERVKELDINQDGSKNTDISNYTSVDENRSTVEDVIKGTSHTGYYKDAIEKTALDNKNRAKFYEAFYNGRGWNIEKQSSAAKYTYKNYVYRAYTYIKYRDAQGHAQIQLCDKPAYFTMYNEAVADYTVPTTSGN